MKRNISIVCAAVLLMLTSTITSASSEAKYVTRVQACGNNAFVVDVSNSAGTLIVQLWAYLPDLSQDQFNRMYAMSLELLASGKQIGYYDSLSTGRTNCGFTGLQEIGTMAATNAN